MSANTDTGISEYTGDGIIDLLVLGEGDNSSDNYASSLLHRLNRDCVKMTVWTMRKVIYSVHLIITACTWDMRVTRGFQYIYNNYACLELFIIGPQELQEAYRHL